MRKLLFSLAAALGMVAAHAIPAIPTPLNFTQSDGSSITVRLVGDEWFSTYVTTDGYTLERATNGDFYYKAGTAVSKVMAHNVDKRSQAEMQFIAANADEMQFSGAAVTQQINKANARKAVAVKANADVPQVGSPRIPIVLVQYSDFKMRSSNPASTFQGQFNTNTRSALQYFKDQSNEQYTPQFDILGPVTLSKTRAYYGARTTSDNDAKPGSMVGEAVKQLTNVDWSLYDNDKNGSVDVVIILYAGPGEAQGANSNAIWPHQWYLSSAYYYGRSDYNAFYQNGVKIDKYACFCETSGSSDYGTSVDGIGTFCHEFSHCLGLPDYYETTYANGYFGMGNWSLMNSGSYLGNSKCPAGYTAYEKEFMGWMQIPTAVANTKYTLNNIDSKNCNAVRIYNPQSSNEYYILENRGKTGWNSYQAASGLMINHITYSATAWSSNTVNNSQPQRMTIIPADNKLTTASESGDLYPYNGNNKLTDTSTPAASLNTGTQKLMGKPITEITKNSDGTVSFWFCKDYVKEIPTIAKVAQQDITIDQFKVSWNAVANAQSYTLNVTGPDFDETYENLEVTSFTMQNLNPGSTYTCKVKVTYTDVTTSDWSAPVQVTTKGNPVMQAAVDSETGEDAFTARWNSIADVASYTLHVRRMGLTNYTQLLHETFAKCTTAATTNIASSLYKYVDNEGWTGKYVYQAVGGVTLSSSSSSGSITSPALDFDKYDGKVVVKVTAGTIGTNTDCSLVITADGASQTVTVSNTHQTEYTVVLNTNGNKGQNVTFSALPNKKITITNIDIYAGDADDVMAASAPHKAPVVSGDQDEQFITGITSNFYNVTGLKKGAEYQYRVKALFTNGSESGWSNVEKVTLKGQQGTPGDVNADGLIDVVDINCVLGTMMGQTAPDAYNHRDDVNGDGKVDIVDINALLILIMGDN